MRRSKSTETFDNRAPPISQVAHNLVSKRSSGYALQVASNRNEARAGVGQEITRLGQLSLARTTRARGGEGESEGKGVHGRLEPLALGSFLRRERGRVSRPEHAENGPNNGLI